MAVAVFMLAVEAVIPAAVINARVPVALVVMAVVEKVVPLVAEGVKVVKAV